MQKNFVGKLFGSWYHLLFLLIILPAIAKPLEAYPYMGSQGKKFTINGKIKDAASGEDLIGAYVVVKNVNGAGSTQGTSSNAYGFYSITLPEGEYVLEFSFIGYQLISRNVKLSESTKLDVELSAQGNILTEVTVTGAEADEGAVVPGVNKLDNATLKKIPPLIGETDVLRSLQLLPGVNKAGEASTNFYVRGGGFDQNLILLDEAVVYNPSHILGVFSIFNADAIKDVKLYKGQLPAAYGGRLSSVVDIRLKEGNNKAFEGTGTVSLLSSRVTIEAPIVKNKSSFIISARRTYADLIFLKLNKGAPKNSNFYFYDLNGKVNFDINPHNKIYVSGFFGRDVNNLNNNQSTQDLNWSNATATLRWNHIFKEKLFLNTTVLYSKYNYDLNAGEFNQLKWKSDVQDYTVKGDFSFFPNPSNTINFGLGTTLHNINSGRGSRVNEGTTGVEIPANNSFEHFIYLSNEQILSDNLTLNYGLRYSLFQNVGAGKVYQYNAAYQPVDSVTYGSGKIFNHYQGLEPRASMRYDLSSSSNLKLAYNRSYQYLHLLSNSSLAFSAMDSWISSNPNIKPQIADQVSLGYFRKITGEAEYEASAEVYYKKLHNQVDYVDHAQLLYNRFIESQIRTGSGKAYGLELMVKKNTGRLTGWVSYTYSRTKRTIAGINGGKSYPTGFDQPNNISIVGSYQASPKWQLSMDWVYSTGRPVNIPLQAYNYDGMSVPIYGDRNSSRLQAYHRLDLAATLKPAPKNGKPRRGYWTFSIYNAYFRKNALLVFVGPELDGSLKVKEPEKISAQKISIFPVIPSIAYSFKF